MTKVRAATAAAILAVEPDEASDGTYVPAGPTWERIDALLALGLPKAAIARAIGCRTPALQLSRRQVTARNARAVYALYRDHFPEQRPADEVDEVVVQRAMEGSPVMFTRAERIEAVRRLCEQGLSGRQTAERLGIHERQVARDRRAV